MIPFEFCNLLFYLDLSHTSQDQFLKLLKIPQQKNYVLRNNIKDFLLSSPVYEECFSKNYVTK